MRKYKIWIGLLLLAAVLGGCGMNSAKDALEEAADEIENTEEPIEAASEDEVPEIIIEEEENPKNDIMIALDPGHQGPEVDMSATEPNAPGSGTMKTKATGGTSGRFSGIPEYQLNLDIALMVRDELVEQGYQVIMTREDNQTAISNAERAQLANDAGADISVRIHANGSESSSAQGALMVIGSGSNQYVGHLYEDSYRLAETILEYYCEETGMLNQGIQTNDTMTGINWSTIPVVILEMGFMTNEQDDMNMADSEYRVKMVDGIVNGINAYYGFEETRLQTDLTELQSQIETVVSEEKENGNTMAVYLEDLTSEENLSVSDQKMQAASLIKLYIAGCVYENLDRVKAYDTYEGDTEDLIREMIRVSDNEAANELVRRLGDGDSTEGREAVNSYCAENGYTSSHMGRLLLESNAQDDNYTSAADCGKFLKAVYKNEIPGAESILKYLKEQERTGKIPAGVPSGVETANKTGELADVENDVAIIMTDKGAYSLCVMMEDVAAVGEAQKTITNLSSMVYEYLTTTD
ncbi:MAG: N-acetylmuramoyl-L-alanine amidase [Ruminococcus sp.]|nr:N-acetylmuramoyl-L-alanine amidase [Ruminococcus sp.]